jgi:hypothetical protein
MHPLRVTSVVALALLAGCAEQQNEPFAIDVPVLFNQHPAAHNNFGAPLSGAEEVPARDTRARGQASFRLSADGSQLHYRLIVANIENVTQAHIHLAPAGANGPFVLWLYPDGAPAQLIAGRSQGILAERTVTEADLVGSLAGRPLADLVEHMRSGNAYVNVHTLRYPPGEVRGQIR